MTGDTDQPWRWWPSWYRTTEAPHIMHFVGSTDRFDVFYDEDDDDYSLVRETDPAGTNFYLFEVSREGLIEFDVRKPDDLDPLNMCQLYQLLEDFKEVEDD